MAAQFKYLFRALLNNGTILEQNQEDCSKFTPGKNCFYDVLQEISNVRAFALYNEENEYLVDLADGHFEINQVPFFIHDEPVHDLKLIYFRRNVIAVNVGVSIEQSIQSYHFGWEGKNNEGSNVKRIMKIS